MKQYRETFVTPAAIDALKNGQPVPSGTVITTVLYKAQLDTDGHASTDFLFTADKIKAASK